MNEFFMTNNNIMQHRRRLHSYMFVIIFLIFFSFQSNGICLNLTHDFHANLYPAYKLRLTRSINSFNKQFTKISNLPTDTATINASDTQLTQTNVVHDFYAQLLTQQQDVLYSCPLNSMCQCTGLQNDTATLLEINCNGVKLYKFPEFLHNSIRYIEMSQAYLHSVDHETFQGLKLRTLKLTDNKIQSISERSFSTMTNSLLTLDLSGNKIQHIPVLSQLRSLTRFVAQRNFITSLDGNWEEQFDSLRSIHLAENEITEITTTNIHNHDEKINKSQSNLSNFATALEDTMSSDKRKMLGFNKFTDTLNYWKNRLESKSFSKLQKLLWLDLSKNRIFHLTPNYFPRSLVTLDISCNLLTALPQNFFENLSELRILILRDNLLKNLHSHMTKSFKTIHVHLEKLDLAQNLFDNVDREWFQNNNLKIRVRALNLEKNCLSYLSKANFKNTGIMHLVLAFNQLEHIDQEAFDGISETLEYLDLEHNNLIAVPKAIKLLNNLKYLYLTSNSISELKNMPEVTNNIRVISLSGNNFTVIPVQGLKNYSQLSYLNMGYNAITDVPENIFAVDGWGSNLQTILLRNNKITHLHVGSLNGLAKLQEISLSFNDIRIHHPLIFENVSQSLKILELSFALFPTRSLESIDPLDVLLPLNQLIWLGIDNNNLRYISNESLANMSELSYINLAFNQIKCLPKGLFRPDIHNHLVEIDFSYNSLEALESFAFNKLADLQILNLQSNKLKSIKRHAFYKLQFLRFIDLSHNQLQNIAHGAFTFLPNLINLNLMQNNLNFFSLKSFHAVTNATSMMSLNLTQNNIMIFEDEISSYILIASLDISHNRIKKSQSFSNLASTLRYLNLAFNDIFSLNNNAFGNLEFLEVLNLAHNNITSLRRRSFQGLNNLQELDLRNNYLDQLQVEQFSNLQKLRILWLCSNRLRALTREVFMNTRLEFLDISDNQLSVWPVPAFSDVGFTLRSIQMAQNELEYLDSSMFINTQFLYEINISQNKITVLPDNAFTYLYNLTNLDLSYNPLVTTNLKEVLFHTPQLHELKLRGINMFKLPHFNLLFLTHLDVSANFIQDLQDFFPMHDMRQLRYVNISHNKIVNASSILEYLPLSVRVLDISHNPLRRITAHDMTNLRHLKELNIQNIKIMPNNAMAFSKLRALKKLHLTSYGNVDEIVPRLPGLRELRFHYTETVLGPQFFSKLINNTKIEKLEINGMNLQTISPFAFTAFGLNHKLHLKISNTKIFDLPSGIFYTLRKVSHLSIDLSHNKINALAADIFYPNKSFWDTFGTRNIIGGIDITHNPIECECGLIWFGHWLRRYLRESAQIKVIQKDDFKVMIQRARSNTCFDSQSGRVIPIMEIYPEDLLCQASALSSSVTKLLIHNYVSFLLTSCTILMNIISKANNNY